MKTDFENLAQQRVYIRNFINRHYLGSKACVNCGKEPTTIVHNEEDPYLVTFICDTCRLGLDKETLESLPKINILEHIEVNKRFSHSKDLVLTEDLKRVLEKALYTDKTLVEYLKENNLSYTKYKEAVIKYEDEIKPIQKRLKEHFNNLRANKISNSIQSHKNESSD